MKKKQLLSLKQMQATPAMLYIACRDVPERKQEPYTRSGWINVYKHYLYIRAAVEKDILKIGLFSRKQVVLGYIEPKFTIFISREERKYITLETATGKWKTAKIDMLDCDRDEGWLYGSKPFATKHTKRVINEYLQTGKLEAKQAILQYQSDILGEKLRLKHRSELEEIDEVMNTVPELPEDFNEWIVESAFYREQYIFYKSDRKTGYCTSCRAEIGLREKPKHNEEGICITCGRKITYKSWKKQKYIHDTKDVGILQKRTDDNGYVLRLFHCHLSRRLEKGWEKWEENHHENTRRTYTNQFVPSDIFEYAEYENTGITRWCHGQKSGYYGYYYRESIGEDCVLYSRNIKQLRKGTKIQYIPMEKALEAKQGHYIHPTKCIRYMGQRPEMEYLVKMGLNTLMFDAYKEGSEAFDWNRKKPWEVLRVSKEQLQQCIRMDISYRQLRTLQVGNEYGIRLTDEQIRYFTRQIGPTVAQDLFCFGHTEKMMKYFKTELHDNSREIGDYVDYIKDLRRLGMQITKNELFPKNFQMIHANVAQQRQELDDRIMKAEISEKDKMLKQMLPTLKEIYHGENETFVIVLPECKEDFNREGRENHNCVGGSYYDRVLKGETTVMFLRRKEEPQKAFCTVEMKGSSIIQCKSIYNGQAPDDAMEFMNKFAKDVAKRIADKRKLAV